MSVTRYMVIQTYVCPSSHKAIPYPAIFDTAKEAWDHADKTEEGKQIDCYSISDFTFVPWPIDLALLQTLALEGK